ncbi:hypothetical protein NOR_03238 [Metarhizium rileyi]|uniref:Ribosome biogenesis protein ALB1 n=1 Tax=Metarhizium rileyi (strain RCEF 4871) TaxID=1649241 RepID=A0A167FLM0_METRR|nr:hypothetical protein NOR_03238 [Metarhizium rileyi RCEF 4871]TWU78318.1 hypothetical protein ED733_008472 [Metarhizium rileyi]
MPSVKNPNGPSKNRLAARAAASKKVRRKRSELARNKISKQDIARGARPGILPTSGPRAKVSAKKARKLEKKTGYALRRRMEAEGEQVMQDAPDMDAEVERQLNGEDDMEIQ